MAPEPASIRGVGAALHWFFILPSQVGSLSSLLAGNDVESYSFTFAHTSIDLVRVVHGDRSLVDEDVLTGVVAIDEAIYVLYVRPFKGSNHSLFVIAVLKDILLLPKSSQNLLLNRGVVIRCIFVRNDLIGAAVLQVVVFKTPEPRAPQ